MGYNKNTDGDGVCERIYNAIWHVSSSQDNPKIPKSQTISSEIPVIFNTPLHAPLNERVKTTGQVSKIASKTDPVTKTRVVPSYDIAPASVKVLAKTKTKVETVPKDEPKAAGGDDFSNYIIRSKAKIRTTSSIGGGREKESLARVDSLDLKVGDYIKRTKMKIRAMSGIGGARALSIK